MTFITVAGLFSHFHLSPPAGPTVQPRVRSFISVLLTSLLVFNRFILSAQIDGIDLHFCCRFHFRYFVFPTSWHLQLPILSSGSWCSSALYRSNFWYVDIFFYPFELI